MSVVAVVPARGNSKRRPKSRLCSRLGEDKMPNVVAVIPARGGSKRLPQKNIRKLDGKPLITYSCIVANHCQTIKRVVVASDSEEILNATYGYADNHILLPSELTEDESTLAGTLKYVIENLDYMADYVVLLQPTCPLRQPSLLDRWVYALDSTEVDGFVTVDRERYKLGRLVGQLFQPMYQPMCPKTLVEEQFRENGVAYAFRASNVLAGNPFTYRMLAIECPKEQSLCNVDSQADWDLLEYYYYQKGYQEMFKELDRG